MKKKYELTDETKIVNERTLHRIRALKDFGSVRAGDLGGWVEKEGNLSQLGACWVAENAQVCENAQVAENAQVYGHALVCGNAVITGCMYIQKKRDCLTVGPVGSRNDFATFAKDKNRNVSVSCGCFYGTLDKFFEKVGKTHGNNLFAKEYRAAIELAKIHFCKETK